MRRLELFLILILSILAVAPKAYAQSAYMVLEQAADGSATHQALDTSRFADDTDPVQQHIEMNKPTDATIAQVLWLAQEGELSWVHNRVRNKFTLIKHAVLPEGGYIQYRTYNVQRMQEYGQYRFRRTGGDWDYKNGIFNRLGPGRYIVEARVIVGNRPVQKIQQGIRVFRNPEDPNSDPQPDPQPAEDNDGDGDGGANPDPVNDQPGEGFTPLVNNGATRIIYVSHSQGNDNNDGRSPNRPVKTLARGAKLIRGGNPDWLLLKAGDTWEGQSFDNFEKSSGDVNKPMVIGVYGEGARPLIIPKSGMHGFKARSGQINGLVIQGLHFYAATRDPGSRRYVNRDGEFNGIQIKLTSADGNYAKGVVIEDCKISHFDNNILVVDDYTRNQQDSRGNEIYGQPGRLQITIRRNIIRYASGSDSHSIGIYIEGSRDSVIEQNFIDHNGWAQTDGLDKRDKLGHNIYAQVFNGPITVRNNIITRAGAHGLQLRAGGDILNNLFVRNALAFYTALNNSRANYNVVLESDDINPDAPNGTRGMGINGWSMDRYEVIGNVVANRLGSRQVPGIDVAADRLIVKDNIVYNWENGHQNISLEADSNNKSVSNNQLHTPTSGTAPNYVAPNRNLGTYAASLGLRGSTETMLDTLGNRKRGTWSKNYTPETLCNYFRAGFNIKK